MKKVILDKDIILTPFFSAFFVIIAMALYYFVCALLAIKFGYFDIEHTGATEVLTYLFYGLGLGVAIDCMYNYFDSSKRYTYFGIIFLWLSALLREMGIQHWLTSHDTVVTKLRFFTNPANPLYEKLIAGGLMALVVTVFCIILIKYFKKIVKGILNLNPFYLTIAVFFILALTTQIADRIPANYLKANGVSLSQQILFILKIFEEGGESLLPLLFGIGFLQFNAQHK